jgi:hypothetical protein
LVPTLDDSVELRHSVKLAGDGQCGRCEVHPGAELRFADATSAALYLRNHLLNGEPAAVQIEETQPSDDPHGPRFTDWIHTRVGDEERDLEPGDVSVTYMHPESVHRFERRDATCFRMMVDGSSVELPPHTCTGGLE